MIRKIFKTGHSFAITVSKKALKTLGWSLGDTVDIVADEHKGELVVKSRPRNSQLSLNLNIRPRLGQKK